MFCRWKKMKQNSVDLFAEKDSLWKKNVSWKVQFVSNKIEEDFFEYKKILNNWIGDSKERILFKKIMQNYILVKKSLYGTFPVKCLS